MSTESVTKIFCIRRQLSDNFEKQFHWVMRNNQTRNNYFKKKKLPNFLVALLTLSASFYLISIIVSLCLRPFYEYEILS